MNKSTLDRLAQNPHYKLSEKQQAEQQKVNRPPMASFGGFDRNTNEFQTHPNEPKPQSMPSKRSSKGKSKNEKK